jgi:hypothetical protein
VGSGVARFFSAQYTKTGKNVPNYHKINHMAIKISNGRKIDYVNVHKIYQNLPLQDPPKFT